MPRKCDLLFKRRSFIIFNISNIFCSWEVSRELTYGVKDFIRVKLSMLSMLLDILSRMRPFWPSSLTTRAISTGLSRITVSLFNILVAKLNSLRLSTSKKIHHLPPWHTKWHIAQDICCIRSTNIESGAMTIFRHCYTVLDNKYE